ncbi:MAG: lysophospholipid acyltransferase family protein [Sphingomicrobium sp.]
MLRIAGCLGWFALIAPIHLVTRLVLGRSGWPPRFLAGVARICGARVHVTGPSAEAGTLLIANHTSWLDILLLAGWARSAFVSKDDLGHGLIHWLADQNATIYVKRSDRKGSLDQATTIARALGRDQPVTIFPEGTTGPGTELLVFRSTLLEAARLGGPGSRVRPVAIDYGKARAEVGWSNGESGKANVMRILRRPGRLRVTLHMLGPLDPQLGRKQLTEDARAAIALTLGFKSSAHSPIGERE